MLLENLRRSPMTRGNKLAKPRRILREAIDSAIHREGVPERLAARISRQLVIKFEPRDLGGVSTWRGMGQLLREEIDRLQNNLHFVERQLIVALPKLSAKQIEDFFAELKASHATIARTILNAALDAADPFTTGRRYLAEFHAVVKQLQRVDHGVARTFANATFMAHTPRAKAMAHFERFAKLMMRFRNDVAFVRTVARAAFRAPDPIKAAEGFIADYDAVVTELTSQGAEPTVARSLASIASVGAEPLTNARKLLENFESVLRLGKRTHPSIARSVALSACRAADPLMTARMYMQNYDAIVKSVSRSDARRAHRAPHRRFDRTTRCAGQSGTWRSSRKPDSRRPLQWIIHAISFETANRAQHSRNSPQEVADASTEDVPQVRAALPDYFSILQHGAARVHGVSSIPMPTD
jgi:hypothetical protein